MASTNNHQTENAEPSYGGQSFQPFEFDESVEPDLPNGVTFELTVSNATPRLSNPDASGNSYPQIILEWKALSTEDESEEAQRALQNTTSEFITFRPKGDRKGNLSKQRLTMLRNQFGIDSDVVPKSFRDISDLEPLCEAFKGQMLTAPVKSALDKTGQWRTTVVLQASAAAGGEEEAEVEEAPKPAAKKPAAKAPAKAPAKKTARR